jgi:hypothetical protein
MDETNRQAAQEYLAEKLTEEELLYEEKQNRATALARAYEAWRRFRGAVYEKCREWNEVTQEETLTCKETPLGDLRVWCAAKSKQLTVHYDPKKLLITLKNAARPEHEKDVLLHIEGYRTGPERSDRGVRLVRSEQPVNADLLLVGELRVLTGMTRQRKA